MSEQREVVAFPSERWPSDNAGGVDAIKDVNRSEGVVLVRTSRLSPEAVRILSGALGLANLE